MENLILFQQLKVLCCSDVADIELGGSRRMHPHHVRHVERIVSVLILGWVRQIQFLVQKPSLFVKIMGRNLEILNVKIYVRLV